MYTPCPDQTAVRPYLTYDEHKAAEAAFQGLPLNPTWSQKAQRVYWGIFEAVGKVGA